MTGWGQSTYNKTEEGFQAACLVCCHSPVSVGCLSGQLRYRIREQLGQRLDLSVLCSSDECTYRGTQLKVKGRGFPGGSLVKNPPTDAGATGSIPGPGRSHMP